MKTRNIALMLALALLMQTSFVAMAKDYQAALFGIKSDGITMNTRSIQKAIDFIHDEGGGTLTFYVGRYLTGSFELKQNVKIVLKEGAILVGVPSVYDYKDLNGKRAMIYADKQDSISIEGQGRLIGQSDAMIENVRGQVAKGHITNTNRNSQPSLICFVGCKNVNIKDIFLDDAANTAIVLDNCSNTSLNNVTIQHKTEGAAALSISDCNGIKAISCYFDTVARPYVSNGSCKDITIDKCITSTGAEVK